MPFPLLRSLLSAVGFVVAIWGTIGRSLCARGPRSPPNGRAQIDRRLGSPGARRIALAKGPPNAFRIRGRGSTRRSEIMARPSPPGFRWSVAHAFVAVSGDPHRPSPRNRPASGVGHRLRSTRALGQAAARSQTSAFAVPPASEPLPESGPRSSGAGVTRPFGDPTPNERTKPP